MGENVDVVKRRGEEEAGRETAGGNTEGGYVIEFFLVCFGMLEFWEYIERGGEEQVEVMRGELVFWSQVNCGRIGRFDAEVYRSKTPQSYPPQKFQSINRRSRVQVARFGADESVQRCW